MEHSRKVAWGTAAALASSLIYAFYNAGAKWLGQAGVSFHEIVFFTFFIGWLALLPIAFRRGLSTLKTDAVGMHALRACFGLGLIYTLVIALKYIPLVDAVMLNNTAPLFVPFIVYYWIGCKWNPKIWYALALGLAGVALILKPDQGVLSWGAVIALASGVFMAFSWTSVRKLSLKEPLFRIIFYYFFFASIITAIPLAVLRPSMSGESLWQLALLGACFLVTTTLLTVATRLITVVGVGILYYSLILFSGLLNWAIWHQVPDGWTLVGMALIIAGGITSILLEKNKKKVD